MIDGTPDFDSNDYTDLDDYNSDLEGISSNYKTPSPNPHRPPRLHELLWETRCKVCNIHFDFNELIDNHHVTYFPEETIKIHRHCHSKLHHSTNTEFLLKNQRFIPSKRDSKLFYDTLKKEREVRKKGREAEKIEIEIDRRRILREKKNDLFSTHTLDTLIKETERKLRQKKNDRLDRLHRSARW